MPACAHPLCACAARLLQSSDMPCNNIQLPPRFSAPQPAVDRKLVKQTVMTSVYGVTFVGARAQVGFLGSCRLGLALLQIEDCRDWYQIVAPPDPLHARGSLPSGCPLHNCPHCRRWATG